MKRKRHARVFKRKWAILYLSIMLIFACCLNFAIAETINISDYPYRSGLIIPNGTTSETFPKGALTNVYLRLDDADGTPAPFINKASLISEGKMRFNCGDIRVADKDGNVYKTNIGGCNSGYTTLTVYVSSVPANNSFACTAQGSVLWGTTEYAWVMSNAVATQSGDSANITAGKEGLASVKVTASLAETPSIKKEVIKAIKVIGEGSINPAIKGDSIVYIEVENTDTVIVQCVTGSTCTVKWRFNEEETVGETLNVSFSAPGKYEIQVETTLTGTELTKMETVTVNAVNLPRIPVSISGQKAVFVGEEYAYTAVIPEKYRGLDVRVLWTLPDGSTVDGKQITMTPAAEGTYSLKCEGWVNGHRDATLKTVQYKITAVGYSFPMPKINVKKTEGLGTYNVTLKIDYMVKKIMGLQYRITYNWNFGDGETLTTNNTVVHHLFTKVGTYDVTMTATDQYNNTTTDNVTITVDAVPIGIGFKVSASNKYMRAPLEIYVRSAISKKVPLDSLESHVWKIDGVAAENTKSEYLRVTFSEPRDHTSHIQHFFKRWGRLW
jgi:hypothetical protein